MDTLSNLYYWSQNNVEPFMFFVLALMVIPFAFGVIFDKSIIRSGFILIGVFGSIAGIFLLLEAQFLAMAQILLYTVGITLVVVIALMLTNPKLEEEKTTTIPANRIGGVITAVIVFTTIYLAIRSQIWPLSPTLTQGDPTKAIGYFMLTFYSLPFEFASILLLAALIGAIMLAKAERPPVKNVTKEIARSESLAETIR